MTPASKPDPYGFDSATAPARAPVPATPRPAGSSSGSSERKGGVGGAEPAFEVNEDAGIHVVTLLRGQILDANQIETLGANLKNYFAKKLKAKVILDMQAVHHLSSAALGMLVMLKNAIEGSGGAFRLAGVHQDLQQVFKITKLNKVLTIKDNVPAAKASM